MKLRILSEKGFESSFREHPCTQLCILSRTTLIYCCVSSKLLSGIGTRVDLYLYKVANKKLLKVQAVEHYIMSLQTCN